MRKFEDITENELDIIMEEWIGRIIVVWKIIVGTLVIACLIKYLVT